jgi:hypothetical protein
MERIGDKWVYPLFVTPVHEWAGVLYWHRCNASLPQMLKFAENREKAAISRQRLQQLEEYTNNYGK